MDFVNIMVCYLKTFGLYRRKNLREEGREKRTNDGVQLGVRRLLIDLSYKLGLIFQRLRVVFAVEERCINTMGVFYDQAERFIFASVRFITIVYLNLPDCRAN